MLNTNSAITIGLFVIFHVWIIYMSIVIVHCIQEFQFVIRMIIGQQRLFVKGEIKVLNIVLIVNILLQILFF